MCVLFIYYFNLCCQSNLASFIHNKGLYSTFPNVSIALRMFMGLMVPNCSGERSFSWMALWRGTNCYDRWALAQHWSFLVFKVTCLTIYNNIHVCFSDILDTFRIAKSRKCRSNYTCSCNQCIWINSTCRSQVQNWKSWKSLVRYNKKETKEMDRLRGVLLLRTAIQWNMDGEKTRTKQLIVSVILQQF